MSDVDKFLAEMLEKDKLFELLPSIKDEAEFAILIWGPATYRGIEIECDMVSWGIENARELVGTLDIAKTIEHTRNSQEAVEYEE